MKTHTEVRKLMTKMNLKNSLEPHTGSSSFPIKSRPRALKAIYSTGAKVRTASKGRVESNRRWTYQEVY